MIELEKLTNIPIIDLGEIYLRAVEYEDYKDMFEYGNDPYVTKTLTWKYNEISDAINSVKNVFLSRPSRSLPSAYAIVYKANNKMIGTCDFHTIDWDIKQGEIGYVINRKYWNKGYMTLCSKALIDFGFSYLELDSIIITHDAKNTSSKRVIEKSGFRFVKDFISGKTSNLSKLYQIKKTDYRK